MSATMTLTLDQFADQIEQMAEAAGVDDFTPAMKRLAIMVRAATLENFAGGHGPDGQPWEALKRPRANSKGGDKPLRDTGILAASVTGGGAGHVETITSHTLTFGTNLEYAACHNFGHSREVPERTRSADQGPWVFTAANGNVVFTRKIKAHKVTIPQRQFLGWSDKLQIDAGLIVGDFLLEAMEKANGGSHA